jgi:hypothetical protein
VWRDLLAHGFAVAHAAGDLQVTVAFGGFDAEKHGECSGLHAELLSSNARAIKSCEQQKKLHYIWDFEPQISP